MGKLLIVLILFFALLNLPTRNIFNLIFSVAKLKIADSDYLVCSQKYNLIKNEFKKTKSIGFLSDEKNKACAGVPSRYMAQYFLTPTLLDDNYQKYQKMVVDGNLKINKKYHLGKDFKNGLKLYEK